jgi:hypothetical protein
MKSGCSYGIFPSSVCPQLNRGSPYTKGTRSWEKGLAQPPRLENLQHRQLSTFLSVGPAAFGALRHGRYSLMLIHSNRCQERVVPSLQYFTLLSKVLPCDSEDEVLYSVSYVSCKSSCASPPLVHSRPAGQQSLQIPSPVCLIPICFSFFPCCSPQAYPSWVRVM